MRGDRNMEMCRTTGSSRESHGAAVRESAVRTRMMRYYNHRHLFLLLLPALVYLGIFNYAPMYGILLAFKDYQLSKGIWGSPWVGFSRFREMFDVASGFGRVLRNTFVISGLKIAFIMPATIALALIINEIKCIAFKKVAQNVSYLPHFLSWVIIASILTEMLSPSRGLVNQVVRFFGGKPVFFLADNRWFLTVIIASDVWQSIGWGSIIYLAAIVGVDPQLYEAAIIDGAGRFRRMFSITVPSITNVIVIMLVLQLGRILNAGFDQIFNLYNFKVFEVADIIDTYAYRVGLLQGDYGMSTAVSLFKNVVGVTLVIFANRLANRLGHTALW